MMDKQKRKFLYRVAPGNFGDDLNSDLVPPLIQGVDSTIYLNTDDYYPTVTNNDSIVVSIGTILNKRIPELGQKYVVGSGTGYGKLPDFAQPEKWNIRFVRGPQTANLINATSMFTKKIHYITDPAILLKDYSKEKNESQYEFGYMPHHGTVSIYWKDICEELGGLYIDPRNSTKHVLSELVKCKLLVAEAMHGAIVADTFRIPWIPIKTAEKINEFKWNDWTQSMSVDYKPIFLPSIWDCAAGNIPKRVINWRKSLLAKKQLKDLLQQKEAILSRDSIFQQKFNDVLGEFKKLSEDINT